MDVFFLRERRGGLDSIKTTIPEESLFIYGEFENPK